MSREKESSEENFLNNEKGMSRRGYLTIAGGAIAAAAIGGAAYYFGTQAAQPAGLARVRQFNNLAGDPAYKDYFVTHVIDEFNKEYSGKIEMLAEYLGWEEHYLKMKALIEAGNPPDISATATDVWNVVYHENMVEPCTDIIQGLGYDKELLPNFKLIVNDDYWMVPLQLECLTMYVNKSWAEEKNITLPLKTWDEVIAAAEAFTEPDKDRWGFTMPLMRVSLLGELLYYMTIGTEGRIYNPDGTPAIEDPDYPQFKKSLEVVKSLSEYSPPESIEWAWGEIRAAYKNEKCGIHIYWGMRTMSEIFGEPYGSYGPGYPDLIDVTHMQPIPPFDSNEDLIPAGWFEGWTLVKNSRFKEESKTFIEWLMNDKEKIATLLNKTPVHELPVAESMIDDPGFWDQPAYERRPDLVPLLKDWVRKAGTIEDKVGIMRVEHWPNDAITYGPLAAQALILSDAGLSYVLQNKPIDEVLAEATEELEKL